MQMLYQMWKHEITKCQDKPQGEGPHAKHAHACNSLSASVVYASWMELNLLDEAGRQCGDAKLLDETFLPVSEAPACLMSTFVVHILAKTTTQLGSNLCFYGYR